MLVSALRSGAHVPPLVDVDVGRTPQLASEPVILHHAPKLTPHDLQIPWFPSDDPTSSLSPPKVQWWSAADLSWRRAVLAQPLWSHALEAKMPRTERRLLFEDVETVAPDALPESVVAWLKRARSRRLQPHLKEEAATHSIATPRPAVESTANGGGAAETDEDGVMVRWVTWLYMPRPPPKSRSPPASAASGVVGSDSTHGTASDSDTDRVDTIANSTSDPQSPIVKQLSSPLAGPGRFHVLHAPYIRHPSLPSGSILLAHPSLDPGEPCLLVHTLRVAGDPGPPRPAATVLEKRFAERR